MGQKYARPLELPGREGGGFVTSIPQDVQKTLRTSLSNYLDADRQYHQLMEDLIEAGVPVASSQRAEVEELRQRRDYLLSVRMEDLRNIGWPTPFEMGSMPTTTGPSDPVGARRAYQPRTPLSL